MSVTNHTSEPSTVCGVHSDPPWHQTSVYWQTIFKHLPNEDLRDYPAICKAAREAAEKCKGAFVNTLTQSPFQILKHSELYLAAKTNQQRIIALRSFLDVDFGSFYQFLRFLSGRPIKRNKTLAPDSWESFAIMAEIPLTQLIFLWSFRMTKDHNLINKIDGYSLSRTTYKQHQAMRIMRDLVPQNLAQFFKLLMQLRQFNIKEKLETDFSGYMRPDSRPDPIFPFLTQEDIIAFSQVRKSKRRIIELYTQELLDKASYPIMSYLKQSDAYKKAPNYLQKCRVLITSVATANTKNHAWMLSPTPWHIPAIETQIQNTSLEWSLDWGHLRSDADIFTWALVTQDTSLLQQFHPTNFTKARYKYLVNTFIEQSQVKPLELLVSWGGNYVQQIISDYICELLNRHHVYYLETKPALFKLPFDLKKCVNTVCAKSERCQRRDTWICMLIANSGEEEFHRFFKDAIQNKNIPHARFCLQTTRPIDPEKLEWMRTQFAQIAFPKTPETTKRYRQELRKQFQPKDQCIIA